MLYQSRVEKLLLKGYSIYDVIAMMGTHTEPVQEHYLGDGVYFVTEQHECANIEVYDNGIVIDTQTGEVLAQM